MAPSQYSTYLLDKKAKIHPIYCEYDSALWPFFGSKNASFCQQHFQVQSRHTDDTNKKSDMLLDYAYTYKNESMKYYSSDMVIHGDSDDTYFIFTNVCSCTTGQFSIINWSPPKPDKTNPKLNGPILT